tara:strand:- start:1538 stop:1885 length:348 start_codon:yes stop_codon:yes gene_type:complete
MSSQIFKESPPIKILFDFLDGVCEKQKNKYVFSKANFKKAQMEEKIIPFCEKLKEYYYKSKLFYINRTMNYKNFITIIRQLCKYHHIAFTSVMKYNKSKYEIIYSIFIPEQLITV